MPRKRRIKAIIDTNLFISFLIGKRLKGLKDSIIRSNVTLIFSEQNIEELELVTRREKFRKYFNQSDVDDLIEFIRIIGQIYLINEYEEICRDPKDDFLLALAKKSKAHYLVTGDNDLLELREFQKSKIITIDQFNTILNKHNA